MEHPKKQPDAWREALKIVSRCPLCSTNYTPESAQLFAKTEAATMVHLTCPSCQGFFVAMIVLLGQGLSSVGMATDLSFADLKRLSQTDPITIDEMIEAYNQIQEPAFLQTLTNKK